MNNTNYVSTRGNGNIGAITASEAILKGISPDGGLYVPEDFPKLDKKLDELIEMNYQELAYEVLKVFLTDFTESELKECIKNAYDEKFDTEIIAPIVKHDDYFFLELFHGKTIAFKDMALSILPHLLTTAARKNNVSKEIVILTATSGDTGKAALEGFADVTGTRIVVFFPEDGVSPVQKRQMVTQEGENTRVIGIKGNFDDAQTGVKNLFNDKELLDTISENGFVFSSANSINIGRLVPQIVYYFYAYAQLVKNNEMKNGDLINFTVPTGNFGNILAGYYAKKLGLPVNKLICASNDNKVLYDFFETGNYNRNREFILTASPSMDILISSNLERFLYHLDGDSKHICEIMNSLNDKGEYNFEIKSKDIVGAYASEEETFMAIRNLYKKGYVIDTHTAVAFEGYRKYLKETNDKTKNVIVSTASPYKFTPEVCSAIDNKHKEANPFELIKVLEEFSKVTPPKAIEGLDKKEIHHKLVCEVSEMRKNVLDFLEI